jgi:hypothetical protein
MKKLILSFFVLCALSVGAQVRIGRTSINCAGATHISNGIMICQTAGQSSNVTVAANREVMIRQGFQQPNWYKVEQQPSDFNVSLFPNPNNGSFTVGLNGFNGDPVVNYQVLDIQGALICEENPQTETDFPITLPSVSTGVYFLQLHSKSGKKSLLKISIL